MPMKPLPSRGRFFIKFLRYSGVSFALILISLSMGAFGYHYFENIPWLDGYLNAAMILTGMGPVNELRTDGGKIFAIGYCLFSGVIFLSAVAVLLAPVVHRFLHRMHLDFDNSPDESEDG